MSDNCETCLTADCVVTERWHCVQWPLLGIVSRAETTLDTRWSSVSRNTTFTCCRVESSTLAAWMSSVSVCRRHLSLLRWLIIIRAASCDTECFEVVLKWEQVPRPPGAMRLRTRRHDFELPIIKYEFNKRNFIVQSLFNYLWFCVASRPSDHYFRSVCLFVCLFVQSFSQLSDPISIKLGHMLYLWV